MRSLILIILSQEVYLFERFLEVDNSHSSEVENYLTQLDLEHKVTVNNGVISTLNLSQGQRRRLALLTAYLENRSIYIFDEWASDQDTIFKEVFYKKLLPELKQKGKIVIAISHDERYFEHCDRLIKLDYGRIIEDRRISVI